MGDCELVESLIQFEQFVRGHRCGEFIDFKRQSGTAAAAFNPISPTGLVNEYASHHVGSGRHKTTLVCPSLMRLAEAQPGFVDECRRLQCLAGAFVGKLTRRHTAKFIINPGEQLRGLPRLLSRRDFPALHPLLHSGNAALKLRDQSAGVLKFNLRRAFYQIDFPSTGVQLEE